MKVEFRTNLGSRDAKELNDAHDAELDHAKCCESSSHELPDALGKALVGLGICREVDAPKASKPASKSPEPAKA